MLRVALCPHAPAQGPVLLVEALPAGSALTLLLARGARSVWVAPGPKVAGLLGGLLLGEKEGFPPEGFHGTLDLRALEGLEVQGREVVLLAPGLASSLNPEEKEVYLGNFRNARAVYTALAGRPLTVRPAGEGEPYLSAVVAAGFLARKLAPEGEGAYALATALLKAFPDPQEALFQSQEGQRLYRMGRTEDLARASLIGVDEVLPRLAEVRFFPKAAYGLTQDRFAYRFAPWNA
ncbi:2-phosphosulfolactate phosphatase [Thermus filiformis]|uniref:Probable 2-phosphosulfolactate phosphatase n=1 Tax=Thermus filiformis TaxID=276 RepID=A0A0A2WPJ4_THEFI|nr:2-phosphosulfolactate phosphatase [Thermus filiformis]KGQ21733.2 phosphosulfolactate phosphohydrolase [Thermus filiformis]